MQIYVCIKHVPDSGALIELADEVSFIESSVKFIVNPFDEYGLEEALRLREKHGGEVVAVCCGSSGAAGSLRAALAMGADRGIHILDQGQFTDSPRAARAIARQIREDKAPDLIFTGKQSIDSEGGRFPYFLAKELGLPVATDVSGLEQGDAGMLALREVGAGRRQRILLSSPCVLGATRGLNEPRYPKLPDIMKAKKKPLQEIPLSQLDTRESFSPRLERLELLPERSSARFFAGSPVEQIQELLRVLREEEHVL